MTIFKVILMLHILAGGTSLLLGAVLLILKKGDVRHKTLGKIYYYSMLMTAFSALVMSCIHFSYFLFIIGVFTSYMVLTGKRALKLKQLKDVRTIDWIFTLTMLLFGLAFVSIGAYLIFGGSSFGSVMLVFGGISLIFVYQDYSNFRGTSSVVNFWLVAHLQRMIGSYIASATAFLVVNNTFLPGIVAWLLPTILLVPLIVIWSRKYELKRTTNSM